MSEGLVPIKFRVNGQQNETEVRPHELLIDFIRERLGLTGTKRSCDMEVCGTCTVLLDGKAVSSCSLFAFELDGKDLMTIEGLEGPDGLHPLQKAFIQCGGFQCGFCTPGMILLAKSLLAENPDPTREQVCAYMDANICRCTGYQMIVESILHAAKEMKRASR
ncbi:MAG TPA: (2Fe-2S)-binding protein [Candidatus Binatia bacterium]|jgi:carbon-monoxide dehydrogenase small subunit|nr:(2Fe-2S)-binding protein [Candidatus Binatia bacterium]